MVPYCKRISLVTMNFIVKYQDITTTITISSRKMTDIVVLATITIVLATITITNSYIFHDAD